MVYIKRSLSKMCSYSFLIFFLVALGLCCCTRVFYSYGEVGLLLLLSTGSRHTGFNSRGSWGPR